MFRVNYGQSNLAQLTDGTGGESFFQGLQTPLAFAPYLTQLDTILKNQYFLTFSAAPSKNSKGQLRNIRVRSVERTSIFPSRIESGYRNESLIQAFKVHT